MPLTVNTASQIDHKPLELHMQLGVDYNVRRPPCPQLCPGCAL